MESNPNEDDLKSSSSEEEEEGGGETNHHGRSYECVFCKRGFTTAQALGGHMNIHRKDRAKNNMPIDDHSINKNYASFRSSFDPTVLSYPPTHHQYLATASSEVHINYQKTFPAFTNNNNYDSYVKNHLHMNLGLRIGESHHHVAAVHDKEKRQRVSEEDDHELDLELRLGHHHDP